MRFSMLLASLQPDGIDPGGRGDALDALLASETSATRLLKVSAHRTLELRVDDDGTVIERDVRSPDESWTGRFEVLSDDTIAITMGEYRLEAESIDGSAFHGVETGPDGENEFYVLTVHNHLDLREYHKTGWALADHTAPTSVLHFFGARAEFVGTDDLFGSRAFGAGSVISANAVDGALDLHFRIAWDIHKVNPLLAWRTGVDVRHRCRPGPSVLPGPPSVTRPRVRSGLFESFVDPVA
jgi:hypothetical protein